MAEVQKVDPVGFSGFAITAMSQGEEGLVYLGTPIYSDFKCKNVGENPISKHQTIVCVGREAEYLLVAAAIGLTSVMGEISTDLVPKIDNTYKLGLSDKRWLEAYLTYLYAGTLKQNLACYPGVTIDGKDLDAADPFTQYVKKAGDTMTGNLFIQPASGDAELDLITATTTLSFIRFKHPDNKQWIFVMRPASEGNMIAWDYYNGASWAYILKIYTNGDFLPQTYTGSANFGNATYYWNDVSAKSFTDRGCIVELDPDLAIQYLKAIKTHPTKIADSRRLKDKKITMRMLDYNSFPEFAKDIPEKKPVRNPTKWDEKGNPIEWKELMPQDGIDLSATISMLIAVNKKLLERVEALEKKAGIT